MAGNLPKSLTIEEAVALMVNLESLPNGKSVEDHLLDIYEDAGVTHDEAKSNQDPAYVIERLDQHRLVCKSRLNLANAITRSLNHEVTNTIDDEGSLLKLSSDSSVTVKLTTESVREWALKLFYISIADNKPAEVTPHNAQLTYRTQQLDALDAAIAKYCESDGDGPKTMPKSPHIIAWIHETYPFVSTKTAEQMCRIMQPNK